MYIEQKINRRLYNNLDIFQMKFFSKENFLSFEYFWVLFLSKSWLLDNLFLVNKNLESCVYAIYFQS